MHESLGEGRGRMIVNQNHYKKVVLSLLEDLSTYPFDICTLTCQKHTINMSVHESCEVVKIQ